MKVTKDLIGKRILGQRRMGKYLLRWDYYDVEEIKITEVIGEYFHAPDNHWRWWKINAFKIIQVLD